MNKNRRYDSLGVDVNTDCWNSNNSAVDIVSLKETIYNNIILERALSTDYRKSLQQLMEIRKMNYTKIAEETLREGALLISSDAVGSIINGKSKPKPGSLILICCALRLPYSISMKILADANCKPSYYDWDYSKQEYDDVYAIVDQIMQMTAGEKACVFLDYLDMFGIKIEPKILNFHF